VLIENGEVVVYHPLTGSKVHFKANGDIDVDAGTANINITAAEVNVTTTGDVNVTAEGDIRTNSDSTRFENTAGSDDFHEVMRSWLDVQYNSGHHLAAWRTLARQHRDRIAALR
jgi:hypothetical protein